MFGQVISYLLTTGSAAGFGVTKDLKALADAIKLDLDDYFDKTHPLACFSWHFSVMPFYLFSHPMHSQKWLTKANNL